MGYFSNGSEGLDYKDRYCERCVHNGIPCPVWGLHLAWNYRLEQRGILDSFIPVAGITNGQCRMFHEAK